MPTATVIPAMPTAPVVAKEITPEMERELAPGGAPVEVTAKLFEMLAPDQSCARANLRRVSGYWQSGESGTSLDDLRHKP